MNELIQTILAISLLGVAIGFTFRRVFVKKNRDASCSCEPTDCGCATSDIKK